VGAAGALGALGMASAGDLGDIDVSFTAKKFSKIILFFF